jgi:hypothetical protein
VRYALSAPPIETSVCHCRMCQKASGGAFMAFSRVRKESFAWTRGTPASFRSSSLVERHFCSACGTPLTYNMVEGRNISVTACSLDDPRVLRPVRQFGIECTLPWTFSLEALPGRRIEEFVTPDLAARFVSYQHPDHD